MVAQRGLPTALRLVAALSLFMLAACQPAPGQTKTYTNADKGLVFAYPAEWDVIDVKEDSSITLASDASLNGVNPDDFQAGDSVIVLGVTTLATMAPEGGSWSALTFVRSLTTQLGNSAELEMIDEAAIKTLGESEFAVTSFRAVSPERPDQASIFFIASHATSELSVLVLGETSRDGADAFRPIFEAVLTSLVISRPAYRPNS